MKLEEIILKIENYKVNENDEEYEIHNIDFFDEITENIESLPKLDDIQKEMIINALFNFLLNQSADMEDCFPFIHLIESIDNPDYKIYDKKLIEFNKKYGTTNSVYLLNRFINGLNDDVKKKEYINMLKDVADNLNYLECVREQALFFYKYQIED